MIAKDLAQCEVYYSPCHLDVIQLILDMKSSVVIVSNRLPISVKKTPEGELEFYPSIGGLATGLASYVNDKRNKWIGWPGIASDKLTEAEKSTITHELIKNNCYPVFLKQKQLDSYYNGYSNSILWPLFHDLPVNFDHHDKYWKAYKAANQAFAEQVLALTEPDSTIWVHDYQLLKLPLMLRKARPTAKIGFFLHIPFPDVDKLANLPSVKSLLGGMLGADLMGFHTTRDVDSFLRVCAQYTRELVEGHTVILRDRLVRVTDFPISIDYDKFTAARKQDSIKAEAKELRQKYKDRKIILTVDRLDPTKGLVERLQAYYDFLRQNQKFHGKVVMVMLAVPSRVDIQEYIQLRENVEKLVASILADFGTPNWQPIDYKYTSLPFESVAALYQVADIAFITPLRDGMNLVAKEYIASKNKRSGVLILSETAGAAHELTDALIVNPAKPLALVKALTKAVTMPKDELKKRLNAMQEQVSTHTIHTWTGNFMKNLQQPIGVVKHRTHNLNRQREQDLLDMFRSAQHPLLIFDYDGVLTNLVGNPDKAVIPETIKKQLVKLTSKGRAQVVVLSGRSKTDLDKWLGDIDINLIAEHGALSRLAGRKSWSHSESAHAAWQKQVLPILDKYAARTPGAHVEIKDYSLVWHYRVASPYYAHKNIVILRRLLRPIVKAHDLEIHMGSKIIEVKSSGANKGIAVKELIKQETDFIMAIGDDETDEDTFRALPLTAYTIKVGRGLTAAHYRMPNVDQVHHLLKRLAG